MSVPGVPRWSFAQAVLWLPVLTGAAWTLSRTGSGQWVFGAAPILATVSYVALWGVLRAGRRVADWVTIARFIGFQALFVAVALTGRITWALWIGLGAVVLLDLADGWTARRFGGSRAGAVLDMETDQLVTLGLALLACGVAKVGIWILLLPAFKYGYVLSSGVLGLAVHDPRPVDGGNQRAKTICALVMAILLACTLPVLPLAVRQVASGIAVGLLGCSFAIDARALYGRQKESASARA